MWVGNIELDEHWQSTGEVVVDDGRPGVRHLEELAYTVEEALAFGLKPGCSSAGVGVGASVLAGLKIYEPGEAGEASEQEGGGLVVGVQVCTLEPVVVA